MIDQVVIDLNSLALLCTHCLYEFTAQKAAQGFHSLTQGVRGVVTNPIHTAVWMWH